MITTQWFLNCVLIGVIAYLLYLVLNADYQVHKSSSSEDTYKAPDAAYQTDSSDPVITSVWCHHGDNKMCQFENLCYNSDQDDFVMFRHEDSIMENIQFMDGSLTLDLSTVQGHNTMQTTIISLPSQFSMKFDKTWFQRSSLIFKRFLPNNLMHMFHDDILPLYDSLKYLSFPSQRSRFDKYNIQIIVFNDTEEELGDEIDRLYQVFSSFPIKYMNEFNNDNSWTCFRDVTLGLSTRTIWYDYGFNVPQAPLANIQITSEHIISTGRYICNNLEISKHTENYQEFIILLTRKENRCILNEGELTLEIVQKTRSKVINLSLDTHSLTDIIHLVRHSKGIIGMHGSLLIISMFLKPFSFVIELFPYAINPEHYTPYKTLCQIMDTVYMAWTNQERGNSVPHPNWSPEMGGINHLEESDRRTIIAQTEVPRHLCCSDPSWLYHIYQDTVVDTLAITSLVQSSIQIIKNRNSEILHKSELIYPSKVKGVTCHIVTSTITSQQYYDLVISFNQPWTLSATDTEGRFVTYEILIQNTSMETQPVFTSKTGTTTATVQVKDYGIYVVWIRCVIKNVSKGPYSDSVFCS